MLKTMLVVLILFLAPVAESAPRKVILDVEGVSSLTFVRIPPGSFLMGTSDDDEEAHASEAWYQPQFEVELTRGSWLATTEVTRATWWSVMGEASVTPAHPDLPVADVTLEEVDEFVMRLQALAAAVDSSIVIRLPTEAQWERAARCGEDRSVISEIGELGWTRADGIAGPRPVATKDPNSWGLYDMFGNVNEVVSDGYAPYPFGLRVDWTHPAVGGRRVVRGGSYTGRVRHANPSDRGWLDPGQARPYIGLRLAAEGLEALIPRDPAPLDIVEVGDRVLIIRPETSVGNPTTVALIGDDETILLDPNVPAGAEAISAELARRGAPPVTRVVISHAHRDHVDGLGTWLGGGAVVIGTAEQIPSIDASPVMAKLIDEGVDPRPSLQVIDQDTLVLIVDGRPIEVRLHRPPHRSGHTDGDLIVHVPAFGLLYVADYYFYDRLPIIDTVRGGSVDGYFANLSWISAEFPASTRVVPGHNRFFPDPVAVPTRDEFDRWVRRVRSSIEGVHAARDAGSTVDDAVAAGLGVEFRGLVARPRYVSAERWIRGFWDLSAPPGSSSNEP